MSRPCSRCGGSKTSGAGFLCRKAGGCTVETLPCSYCKGSGVDPEYPAEWAAAGARLRALRQERDFSLRELARRMGASCVDLSQAERGVSDPARFLAYVETMP